MGPTGPSGTFRGRGPALPPAFLAVMLFGSLRAATAATPTPADAPQVQAYSATFDGPTAFSLPALPQQLQALSQTGGADPTGDGLARTNTTSAVVGFAGETPRRRREQWDLMGPAMLLGGTLALLVLAAVGHLASKALLASMLSAALSAVQLGRQPNGRRPG